MMIARGIWVLAVFGYVFHVLQRATGVWGFTFRTEDAIALLLIAGVAGFVWRPVDPKRAKDAD